MFACKTVVLASLFNKFDFVRQLFSPDILAGLVVLQVYSIIISVALWGSGFSQRNNFVSVCEAVRCPRTICFVRLRFLL